MLFFDVKRVLIIVALIVGIMAIVIFGFLQASGIFSFDSRDSLYQGVLSQKYTQTTPARGEPLDEATIEILNDSEYLDEATTPAKSGTETGNAANPKSVQVRVLLFLGPGELAAKGNVTDESNTFSLVKTVDFSKIERASDAPHMNRDRDMLSYRDVENALENGGFFRIEYNGRYLSEAIIPESSEFIP